MSDAHDRIYGEVITPDDLIVEQIPSDEELFVTVEEAMAVLMSVYEGEWDPVGALITLRTVGLERKKT